jgi:hypothetical protein
MSATLLSRGEGWSVLIDKRVIDSGSFDRQEKRNTLIL